MTTLHEVRRVAQAARSEQLRREMARRHPLYYANYIDAGFPGYGYRHAKLLFRELAKAESGELWAGMKGDGPRILLISLPPGHYKTSILNKFIAWFIGKRKAQGRHHQVGMVSYGADLATTNSRIVRDEIFDPIYRNIFPDVQISPDARSVNRWGLVGESYPTVVAVGTGGPLTGQRTDLLAVDDPVKDAAEANSAANREEKWQWFVTVGLTRLRNREESFVVIPHTRWHEDDLTGRILKQQKENPGSFRVRLIRIPALAETHAERVAASHMGLPLDLADPLRREPGEALCPSIIEASALEAQRQIGPAEFEALYQGRPRRVGGYLVGRQHFKMLSTKPRENVRWVWATDWAFTEKELAPAKRSDPDYTVAALVGLWQPDGVERNHARLVIAEIRRIQATLHDAKRMAKDAAMTTPGVGITAFDDNIDRLALQDLMADPELYRHRIKLQKRIRGDKVTKAQPWLDRTEGGLVYVVEGAWNAAFFDEVEAFPRSVHDDQVDAVTVGFHFFGLGQRTIQVVNKPTGWFS